MRAATSCEVITWVSEGIGVGVQGYMAVGGIGVQGYLLRERVP